MAEAFHRPALKHLVRRAMLRTLAAIPVTNRKARGERILLIRPDHLGDVLLTIPAVNALRTARPHAEIHMLVGPWSADVMANQDAVDMVLTLPFPGFNRGGKPGIAVPYRLALRAANQLRHIGYSSAVILRPDHWWGAMVASFAGIPQRIGYELPDVAPFLTHKIPWEHQHAVHQNARLMEQWTGQLNPERLRYEFPLHDDDRGYIDGYLSEWGIAPDQRIFCIHPGSGTWAKRWEPQYWADVADTLADQLDAQVVFTGGDHELSLVQTITGHMRHTACLMVGDTEIGQLAALYARARVVLGPDSGPMHLAAAVHTPTVTLFGPADPVEFAPWGERSRHLVLTSEIGCRPCRVLDWGSDNPEFHPCVREITIGRVLEAARLAANS